MISMQRSLSSPVAIHSSPPRSPSATRASRSPTPSPEHHVDLQRARRFRSRSPPRSAEPLEPTSPTRRGDDLLKRASLQGIPILGHSRKPIIDQATVHMNPEPSKEPLKTPMPGSPPSGDGADKTEPSSLNRSLLPDVSLYSNNFPDPEDEGTSLEELAHLVRLSKYQERKRANTRIRLQRSLVSTALSARLMRSGESVHRNLVDSFRGDDKKTFAALYNAMIDVRKSCEETRRWALLEPDMDLSQLPGMLSSESLDTATESASGVNMTSGSISSFLNDISASARETFLSFLTQIRTNPDYLATRLSCLNQSELVALTSFYPALEPIESVLPYHNRSAGRPTASNPSLGSAALGGFTYSGSSIAGSSNTRQSIQERGAIERLLSFQRHDPISALVYTCFANSAGPDSAEDKRRTVTWATTCARLMSTPKTGRENIVISILNVWISMRDWAGKSNMEWYLMKILEDGSFLLDRAEDQHGTRFHLSNFTAKDSIASEEFYTRAVEELFEVIDDEDATGIPEGLIELGNEILKRVDKRLVDDTRKWLVTKCLFTQWLLGVVIHPEAYGMMSEYHITEYGRQKILKAVATHAQKLVIDMLTSKTPVSTPPKIAGHIRNIYGRFESSRSKRKTRLLPARSITSLRETVEVHPHLVISPADLAVLVNALFPERRPQSAQSGSFRSGAPSISGFSAFSQPMSAASRHNPNNFDTMSVVSTSAESVFSDATTSKEPLLDEQNTGSSRRSSPPVHEQGIGQRSNNYEDDGYRLRLAMHEMVQSLGQEVVFGSCHPCAERWAVLFISTDGNHLSTQMTYDPDDDVEMEESSSTSDTDQEELEDDRPELDKDYHQLRDSILKLVEEFEIPQDPEVEGSKAQTFSNRASRLKKYRSKNKIITAANSMASRNPYRQRTESIASSMADSPPRSLKGKESATQLDEGTEPPSSVLISMLTAAESQSRAQSDFVSAHLYWRTLRQLNALSTETLRRNGFAILLNIFSRGPRDLIRRSAAAIEEYDAWLVWLKQSQERAEGMIDAMMRRLRSLRDKMWYVTDVRNSAPYEDSRNIAVALKTMGVPHRWEAFQRARNAMQRGPAASYIFRTESQVLDLVAAPEDQGGPNKLRDEQAEKTARWLSQNGIENFCSGEERIHRFCCEIENCVTKLVGDSILDGPVLWSSELYLRDRRTLENSRLPRDGHAWDDSASVISDSERRYGSAARPPSLPRDLRTISTQNLSQASFDSGRYSFSRASTVLSDAGHDGPDYFGASSPVHTIDPTMTYWSPFTHGPVSPSVSTSRAHSPTTSMTSLSGTFYPQHHQLPSHSQHSGRPGTSASSNETVLRQRLSEEKTRFLNELKQTLTSLLLSDLGNLVFARGSETDTWFTNLGQECIDRKEEIIRRERQAEKKTANRSSLKQRTIEKKRSFGDLRGAGVGDGSGTKVESPSLPLSPGIDSASQGNESSATSDTISAKNPAQSPRKAALPEFPFTRAYQRLLKMFCVHPNPYAKLNALFELEHLIIASLNSGSRKARLAWARSDLQSKSAGAEENAVGANRPQPLDEAIDNVKERRSHALIQGPLFSPGGHAQTGRTGAGTGNPETRSVMTTSPANTDAITNVLQYLFRDPTLRPKTLFRDLQFISSLVPASVLDKTDRGKAFWDTSLAALSLKQEVCRTMVEVADDIVKHYTQTRSGPAPTTTRPAGSPGNRSSSTADGINAQVGPPSSPPTPPLPLTTHSLADAAHMWTITAKEGDPTAQRELAIFYLSNPELVERTTLPLVKPRDVFKQAVMKEYGGGRSSGGTAGNGRYPGGGGGSKGQSQGSGSGNASGKDADRVGDVRSDPALMCIAIHWMEAAERGGDELARMFLGQNEIGGGMMG